MRNDEARQQCRFLLVETHEHLTSIVVLTVHGETSLLYTFQRSMQAIRNINLWQEKEPIYKLSRRKALKTQQIWHYKHTRKTSEPFCCASLASALTPAIILLTQVSLQKFPLQFIIPCSRIEHLLEFSYYKGQCNGNGAYENNLIFKSFVYFQTDVNKYTTLTLV